MTRVAYLVSDYSAPSHTFVRREIVALRELGMEVCAYSIQPVRQANGGAARAVLGAGILKYLASLLGALARSPRAFFKTWTLSLSHRPPGLKALLWSQFHFIEAAVVSRNIRQDGVSRIHVHFANSGATVAMLASKLSDIPFSLTLHGISETDFPAGLLLPEKLESASFVACASYFMRAQAMRLVRPKYWDKMHIVRCGVKIAPDSQPAKPSSDDAWRMVCVGRLSAEKGYHGLIEALRPSLANGEISSLTIIGDGPQRDELRRLINQKDLSSSVELLGFLEEKETLEQIEKADVLVMASLMEGLPVVLMEAMMLGKPVIAPRIAGIPELVEEGRHGLLFTPSDWADLRHTVSECLKRRAEWSIWGEQGRKRILEEFVIERSAAAMLALLTEKGWR